MLLRSRASSPDFTTLFDRHARDLRRYAARRVGPDAADDLVAQTFLVAFERRHRHDPERGSVVAWLYGIATNLLRRHRRDEVRLYRALAATGTDPVEEDLADRVAADVDAAQVNRRLASALADLTSPDRDALLLHVWAGLPYDEVASATGVPIGTVRSRIHRARSRLRSALADVDAGRDTDVQREAWSRPASIFPLSATDEPGGISHG